MAGCFLVYATTYTMPTLMPFMVRSRCYYKGTVLDQEALRAALQYIVG